MEAVGASSILYCGSSLNIAAADHCCSSLSSVRQLGFPLIFKQRKKCTSGFIRPLSLSVVNASVGSQDGSSSAVEDDKKGLFLGPQRDASGSVVGFHLRSHSDCEFFNCCFVYSFGLFVRKCVFVSF